MSAVHTIDLHDALQRLLTQPAFSTSETSETGEPPRGGEPGPITLNSSTAKSGGIAILGQVISSLVITGGLTVNLPLGTTMPDPPHTEAISITEETVKKIVSLLARCIETQETSAAHGGNERKSERNTPVSLVKEIHLRALRLISVCPVPLRPKDLTRIFPDIHWVNICRDLTQKGWIKKRRQGLQVPISVGKQLRKDAVETSKAREAWIAALEPLRDHCDMAIILGIMYVRRHEWDKAIYLLSDIADSLEPGPWNSVYLGILAAMHHRKLIRKLQPRSVVRLHNSIGLCLSDLRRWPEAIERFILLRRYSTRIGDSWGIGQSYVNTGVVYYNMGRRDLAENCYRSAVLHARRTEDKWLLGRSLHNLGMTVMDRDIDAAIALIEESASAKVSAGDFIGSVNVMAAQARIFEAQKEYGKSVNALSRAERAARKHDLRHLRCKLLWDLARLHSDLERHQEAWELFSKARKLASKEQFEYEFEAITLGEAVASVGAKDFDRAEKLFEELVLLTEKHATPERRISILHDLGVVRYKKNDALGARVALAKAIELSLASGYQDWIYRCRLVESLTIGIDGNESAIAESVHGFAIIEEQDNRHDSAGQLWMALARRFIENSASDSQIFDATRSAERCFRRGGNKRLLIDLKKMIFLWRRESGHYQDALRVAREIERVATGRAWAEERIRAIDEQAVCLQRLLKYRQAEALHQRALSLGEQAGVKSCLKNTLNNLGSLFRNTGKPKAALKFFARAAELESPDRDLASWIAMSINYALALYDAGKTHDAQELLLKCEKLAQRARLWDELVRTVHTQANHSWRGGDPKRAKILYMKALGCAERNSVTTGVNDLAVNLTSLIMHEISEAWEAGRVQAALAAFQHGQRLCSDHKLPLRRIELFVRVGDHYWNHGEKYQFKALQMYIYAMNAAAGVSLDEVVRVGVRASQMVLHCDRTIRMRRIGQLEEELRRWLTDGSEWKLDGNIVDFVLWPLRAGRSLAVAFETRGNLSAKAQIQIVQSEVSISVERTTAPNLDASSEALEQ